MCRDLTHNALKKIVHVPNLLVGKLSALMHDFLSVLVADWSLEDFQISADYVILCAGDFILCLRHAQLGYSVNVHDL